MGSCVTDLPLPCHGRVELRDHMPQGSVVEPRQRVQVPQLVVDDLDRVVSEVLVTGRTWAVLLHLLAAHLVSVIDIE